MKINLYRCGLIHRLDKYTSGLLVLAKNESSQKYLSEQFHKKTIKRKYIALIWGNLNLEKGVISGFIGRDPNNRKRMTIYNNKNCNINKGKLSITHYKVLERFKYITYISCKLETGRTHQIRTHFKYIGHPLFNDSVYGGNKIFFKRKLSKKNIDFFNVCLNILQRQALHAVSISFIHPKNGIFHFSIPIPKDFKIVLSMCRDQFHDYNNVPCNNI
ncbi:RluA family pseudouridine synthase [Blattabacterium cuenoti]|uniref:RluA family pseudouridine synthase n=1 Tax=Blattabacterium cuenoti TaxID=1653831 RepID=UPI001EE9B093|nr:pseudouridine synthase [Blattabacterium cuenoti]